MIKRQALGLDLTLLRGFYNGTARFVDMTAVAEFAASEVWLKFDEPPCQVFLRNMIESKLLKSG
jgi:hypothetical protein